MDYKIYRKDNYITIVNILTGELFNGHVKEVFIDRNNTNKPIYVVSNVKDFDSKNQLIIDHIFKEDGSLYALEEFETFYTQNTGNFNSGGTAQGVQSVTGSSVDNTDPSNPIINAVEEAPIDGQQYTRQDGTWTQFSGGGSQDLQSVLDEGTYAEFDDGDNFVRFMSSDGEGGRRNGFYLTNPNNSSAFVQSATSIQITAVNDATSTAGIIRVDLSVPTLIYSNEVSEVTYVTKLVMDGNDTVGDKLFRLPHDKVEGEYIIATTVDLNLQKVLDGGYSAVDQGISLSNSLPEYPDICDISSGRIQILGETISTSIIKDQLVIINLDRNFGFRYGFGYISSEDNSVGGKAQRFEFPIDKPSGTYTLATLDDIIVLTPTDLQSAINNGNTASVDSGHSSVSFFGGSEDNRTITTQVFDGANEYTGLAQTKTEIGIASYKITDGKSATIKSSEAKVNISENNSVLTGSLTLVFEDITESGANVATLPAKGGTIAYLDDIDVSPKINIVPVGDFTIPDGTATRILTFTDTSSQIVTLPAISDSIGSIYFITNDSIGTLDIVSKTGSNDIWDSMVLTNSKGVTSGLTIRLINDGLNYKIL